MYNSESPFFDAEQDNVAMLTSYYNQLNRFPFLPLSSAVANMASQPQTAYGATPFSAEELSRGFNGHPGMPPRRFSSSSTSSTDSTELCLPTSSLFFPQPVFQDLEMSPSPSPAEMDCTLPGSAPGNLKISIPVPGSPDTPSHATPSTPSSAAPLVKKTRAPPRERVSTKDFKPPDVSGMSKREARLVKNRAAAFLSRQRKREEFEELSLRVVELEKENARLQNQFGNASGSSGSFVSDSALLSEISTMRSKLATSEQRASELREELAQLRSLPSPTSPTGLQFPSVKKEVYDLGFDRSPSPTSSDSSGSDKDRATRLGMMVLMSLSTLFSNAAAGAPTSKFTLSSDSLPVRPEWEINAAATLDGDAEFDVHFATSPEDGKVRVRLSTASPDNSWDASLRSPTDSLFSFDVPSHEMFGYEGPFSPLHGGHKKRLRISLKNARGGEWDVEVC